jgi:hypothetical protein
MPGSLEARDQHAPCTPPAASGLGSPSRALRATAEPVAGRREQDVPTLGGTVVVVSVQEDEVIA